ncbi:Phage Gp37Gp68, partial [mine drainage metagenome]
SRSDLFHEAIPVEFREKMWAVMKQADRHVFQILTKRPENLAAMLPADWGDGYPNVWLGVSGETFETAWYRGRELHSVRAGVRFLSAEPWLETSREWDSHNWLGLTSLFNWIIVGGESGAGCRPMDERTARSLILAAALNEIPVFLKQLGGHPDARSHQKAVLGGRAWTEMPAGVPA